MDQMFKISIIE